MLIIYSHFYAASGRILLRNRGPSDAPYSVASSGSNSPLANSVRKEGVEPSRLYSHRLLRPACLPVPPLPQIFLTSSRSGLNLTYCCDYKVYLHLACLSITLIYAVFSGIVTMKYGIQFCSYQQVSQKRFFYT